jgi:hypothetical protein
VYIQNQIWVWKNILAYTTNPPEKGGKKKNPSINLGQAVEKGRNFFFKTLVLTLGSPPEKGEKK